MPSPMTLVTLPTEILDDVTVFIQRPQHLLHLALTNSLFYRVVIPRHLYRRLKDSAPCNTGLWTHIIEDAERGKSVRYLNVGFSGK